MSINSYHQINIEKLFLELSQVFNGNSEIEKISSQELRAKAKADLTVTEENPLSDDITSVIRADDAHPICSEILKTPFNWVPPETSKSDLYKNTVTLKHM